jgi:hypothetical protein
MTISYQLTIDDLIRFGRDHYKFVPKWHSTMYWYVLLPMVMAFLAIATSLVPAVLLVLLFAIGSMALGHVQAAKTRKAIYSAENTRISTLPMRATLSPLGLQLENDACEVLYRWTFISSVEKTARYVRFVITPTERQHIPITAFTNQTQVDEFVGLANSYKCNSSSTESPLPGPAPQVSNNMTIT